MKHVRLIALALLIMLAFGCAKNVLVSLDSNPQGAEVISTADKKGPQKFLLGNTPLQHRFVFAKNGPTVYNLEFVLPGYETKTISLNEKSALSGEPVKLDKEVVREIQKYVVEVSEELGYTIQPKRVRAWIHDIEREGMVASKLVQLNENQSITGMTCSPDGSHLYFSLAEAALDDDNVEKITANIRAINTSGGGMIEVTSGLWLDTNPNCTKDGHYIIFNSNRFQPKKPDLFRISTDKTSGISVIRQTSEGASYEPSAHTSDFMAYTFRPIYNGKFSNEAQIWTLGGENIYPTQLKNGEMPAVSPNGKEIAFVGNDGQLWKMPINAQNPVQLTNEPVNIEGKKYPSWSPDGRYILFASDVGKDDKSVANYDIWMIPAEGGGPIQLTTNGSEDLFPLVSPDGKYIYFVSNRGYKEGIWRIMFPTI